MKINKNFTKNCIESNRTKLSYVKEAIELGKFDIAIKIVGSFPKISKNLSIVKETKDVINNPRWMELYFGKGVSLDFIINKSIEAIKLEYKF